jgi:hypothetical protein
MNAVLMQRNIMQQIIILHTWAVFYSLHLYCILKYVVQMDFITFHGPYEGIVLGVIGLCHEGDLVFFGITV